MKENTTYFLNFQSTWSGHRDSAVGDLNTNFLQKETQNLLTTNQLLLVQPLSGPVAK